MSMFTTENPSIAEDARDRVGMRMIASDFRRAHGVDTIEMPLLHPFGFMVVDERFTLRSLLSCVRIRARSDASDVIMLPAARIEQCLGLAAAFGTRLVVAVRWDDRQGCIEVTRENSADRSIGATDARYGRELLCRFRVSAFCPFERTPEADPGESA